MDDSMLNITRNRAEHGESYEKCSLEMKAFSDKCGGLDRKETQNKIKLLSVLYFMI